MMRLMGGELDPRLVISPTRRARVLPIRLTMTMSCALEAARTREIDVSFSNQVFDAIQF